MRSIAVTLLFVGASISVTMAAICYRLILTQPRLCENCGSPANLLTEDGHETCEICHPVYACVSAACTLEEIGNWVPGPGKNTSDSSTSGCEASSCTLIVS